MLLCVASKKRQFFSKKSLKTAFLRKYEKFSFSTKNFRTEKREKPVLIPKKTRHYAVCSFTENYLPPCRHDLYLPALMRALILCSAPSAVKVKIASSLFADETKRALDMPQ